MKLTQTERNDEGINDRKHKVKQVIGVLIWVLWQNNIRSETNIDYDIKTSGCVWLRSLAVNT